MSKLKLFLILASALLISCANPNDPGGDGTGGNNGGGTGTDTDTGLDTGYVLPKGSLTQEEQKKDLDPNVSTKVLWARVSGGKYYRIPALITTKKGTILAATDVRHNGTTDLGYGNVIDVAIKRSTDLGNTWSEDIVFRKATANTDSYGDSFFINCHNGDVILGVVNHPGYFGQNSKSTLYRSTDDGLTWTKITDLSIPGSGTYGFGASGQGLTLRHGDNAGKQRLMFAYFVKMSNNDLKVVAMISDDDGKTWKEGGNTGVLSDIDETKAFELSDGRVLLNHRRTAGKGGRAWSIADTYDGAFRYLDVDNEIVDPGNNADLVRYEFDGVSIFKDNYALLIHANSPANSVDKWFGARKNHHIKLTRNEFASGNTSSTGKYPISKQLVVNGENLYSGYPTITVLPDGSIGTLTEETAIKAQDEYNIVWRRCNLYWLTGGTEYVDYSTGPRFQQAIK